MLRPIIYRALLLALGLIVQSLSALAKPVQLSEDEFRLNLGPFVQVLEDPSGELTLAEVQSSARQDSFLYDGHQDLYFGFSRSAYWLRFTLVNASQQARALYLQVGNPLLESVELFEPAGDDYRHYQLGDRYPSSQRAIGNNSIVFPLSIPANTGRTYLLRIQSRSTLMIPLFLSSVEKYNEYRQHSFLRLGLFYGIISGLLIYNLLIYLGPGHITGIRRVSYLYYIIFILATLSFHICLDGLGKYFWPASTGWVSVLYSSIGLMVFACAQFARSILGLKDYSLWLDRLLAGMAAAGLLMAVLCWLGNMERMAPLVLAIVGPAIFFIMLAGIVSWYKGYRPARYFMLAWIGYLLAAALYDLSAMGVLNFSQPAAQALTKIGTVIQALLLSLALSDHINTLNQMLKKEINEREQAQQELTLLNEELEERVRHRTQELHQSNEDLQNTMRELEQTQNYLVESEKMASLGQLVAGVAHEINTPVGVAVTAASYLQEQTEQVNRRFLDGALRRQEMTDYVATSQESTRMILGNLQRAATLIKNFKQVAVDQSSEEKRVFPLKEYLTDVVSSLTPKLKKRPELTVEIAGDDDVRLNSYPGVLSQIVSNLIMNSLRHGFEPGQSGKIRLQFAVKHDQLRMTYRDSGKGVDAAVLKKMFDPFYTTRRAEGGSGLGLYIVFNLVTQKLKGTIKCESEQGHGIAFFINIPWQSVG